LGDRSRPFFSISKLRVLVVARPDCIFPVADFSCRSSRSPTESVRARSFSSSNLPFCVDGVQLCLHRTHHDLASFFVPRQTLLPLRPLVRFAWSDPSGMKRHRPSLCHYRSFPIALVYTHLLRLLPLGVLIWFSEHSPRIQRILAVSSGRPPSRNGFF